MAPNQRRSWLAAPAPLQYARADNNFQFLARVTNPKVFVIASKQQRALALPRPGRSAAGFDRIPFRKPRPGPPRPLAPQRGPGLIRLHLVNLRAKSCASTSVRFPGGSQVPGVLLSLN